MGYIEGILGGYVKRHREIELNQIAEDTQRREREGKVFEQLLNSPDAEIRALAGTGLIEWAQPRKTKGGPSGWLSGYEKNPIYPALREAMETEKPTQQRKITPGLASKQRSGYISPPTAPTSSLPAYTAEDLQPAPPDPQDWGTEQAPSMAQPATSPTEVGAPPMTPPTGTVPTPRGAPLAAAPPSVPYGFPQGSVAPPKTPTIVGPQPTTGPPAARVDPAAIPGSPAPDGSDASLQPTFRGENIGTPPPSAPINLYNETYDAGPRVGRVDTETVMRRPQAFPTTADLQAQTYEGRDVGEYNAAVKMFERINDPDPQRSAANWIMQKELAQGGTRGQGTEYERTMRTFANRYFGKALDQLSDEQYVQVQEMARKDLEDRRFAGGTGSGRAAIITRRAMPIGITAGRQLGVSPNLTLADLDGIIPLDDAQKLRVYTITQVEEIIGRIDQLLPKVYPNVDIGVMGKLQSQFSLAGQWLTGQPDLAELDASINLALANMTRIAGETGNLATSDIDRARAALAQLTPQIFGGDTLATAKARLGVVHDLLAKAKAVSPGYQMKPGAVNPNIPNPNTATPNPNVAKPPPAAAAPNAPPAAATTPMTTNPADWSMSPDGKTLLFQGKPL